MGRKHVETSKEAELAKTDESKQRDYDRIISAYQSIGTGHYEDCANYMREKDLNVVSRRMKEMREKGMLINLETKKPTSRGRNAFIHALSSNLAAKTDNQLKPEKALVGKSVSDYSKDLINQPTLFQ